MRYDEQNARAQVAWKPFIIDITVINAHTPSTMPAMEIAEMNEMK